jgi:hypothetical protein
MPPSAMAWKVVASAGLFSSVPVALAVPSAFRK